MQSAGKSKTLQIKSPHLSPSSIPSKRIMDNEKSKKSQKPSPTPWAKLTIREYEHRTIRSTKSCSSPSPPSFAEANPIMILKLSARNNSHGSKSFYPSETVRRHTIPFCGCFNCLIQNHSKKPTDSEGQCIAKKVEKPGNVCDGHISSPRQGQNEHGSSLPDQRLEL